MLKVENSLNNRSNDGTSDIEEIFWLSTMENNFDKYKNDILVTKKMGIYIV